MTILEGIRRYKQMPLRCTGIFQLSDEVNESGEKMLQLSQYYKLDGEIVMDNFTAQQRLFLCRDSVVAINEERLEPVDRIGAITFIGKRTVILTKEVKATSGEEGFSVARLQHRQWDMTVLTWVDFTAEYVYDLQALGKDKAALIAKDNVVQLTGQGNSWSDWHGGWIIMTSNFESTLSTIAERQLTPGITTSRYRRRQRGRSGAKVGDFLAIENWNHHFNGRGGRVGVRSSPVNNDLGRSRKTMVIGGKLYFKTIEYQSRGAPHVMWVLCGPSRGMIR
ncbi:uncharacterized protein MELLADRAFT_107872 [Melampsora larici-populina 98AG31]|uniref:Uncharacterized protein n=1 Tax=Melampsora larici-populina (strain 98AG31 / pathotype 3-4-7) TaxID=747676 RepID=F4RR74_MELLP|nr:uncharacterized protein MELLADRAFT_107872 [Melampsora larici-populina 98AG31]EGG05200.1 hypothetical protein MELLADRAFT_107872 [Melampsora larici-populina 98AG31]